MGAYRKTSAGMPEYPEAFLVAILTKARAKFGRLNDFAALRIRGNGAVCSDKCRCQARTAISPAGLENAEELVQLFRNRLPGLVESSSGSVGGVLPCTLRDQPWGASNLQTNKSKVQALWVFCALRWDLASAPCLETLSQELNLCLLAKHSCVVAACDGECAARWSLDFWSRL